MRYHFLSITCWSFPNIRPTQVQKVQRNSMTSKIHFKSSKLAEVEDIKWLKLKYLYFFYPDRRTSCPSDTTCPKQLSYHIPLTFPQQLVVSANLPPVIAYKQDEASLTRHMRSLWGKLRNETIRHWNTTTPKSMLDSCWLTALTP